MNGTKISLEIDGITTTWESKSNDLTATDLLSAFASLMIGQTFYPCTIIAGMKEYIENNETN